MDVLVKHLKVPNKIVYSNRKGTKTSKQDSAALVQHANLLLDLQEVHAQLCFRQKDVEVALGEVVERNPQWKLTTTDKQDFCEKMALRIRTMAMHFRRAQAKEHPPTWLAKVVVLKNVAPLTRSEQKEEKEKEEELVLFLL